MYCIKRLPKNDYFLFFKTPYSIVAEIKPWLKYKLLIIIDILKGRDHRDLLYSI